MRLPLALAKPGDAVVVDIVAGRQASIRLAEMGIRQGKKIRIIDSQGPVLITVNGTKYVLGKGLAMKVIVDVKEKN